MATYSNSTTLTVPAGGTDEISISIEETGYDWNTNIATLKITLGFYIGIRWDDSAGGDVFAEIHGIGAESAEGYGKDLSCSFHLGKTNYDNWRYTWKYETFTKTMHCTCDGKASFTVNYWGWRRGTNNNWIPSDKTVFDGSIFTTSSHNRASTLTLNNNSINIDNTSTLSMTVNRKSTLMTKHDLIITYPSASGQGSETIPLRNGTTTSNTYKASLSLLDYLPANGKTIQGQVVLRTYYLPYWESWNPEYVDSAPQTFTAIARDSDIAPTLTLNTLDWTNDGNVTSGLIGNLDNYIFNVSKCVISGTSETKYNATPVSFGLFTNDDKPLGIVDTGEKPNYEFYLNQIAQNNNFTSSNTLKVKITDSRGLSGSINVPLLSFIPYIKKSLNETYDIARVNPTSSTVEINSVTGKWWKGDFLGNQSNDLTISWAYKEASSTGDYITGGTIDTLTYDVPSGTYTSYDNTTQTFTISNYAFPQNFNYQKAYSIRLTVTDAVTGQIANPLYITISAGVPNFAIHKDTILINGKTIWDILYPVGSVYMTEKSSSEFNPNNYFTGTTWSQVSGYYLYAGTTSGVTSYTGQGAQSHTLTAAESGVPAHSHGARTANTTTGHGSTQGKDLTGHAYNVMWDDGRDGGMARDGIVSIGGWTRNRSWSGTNGDASRSLGVDANHGHTVTVDNNTAANASSGHPHNIASYTICVWKRTA